MRQFWKLPFRKSGYPSETIEISTKGKIVGDYIVFPRKYFQLSGTIARYFDKDDSQYKSATIASSGDAFLLARNIDEELTDSLGITVYTRIQLNHSRVANTTLQFEYQPFGDLLDPEDFEQALHTTADVQHKSLVIKKDISCETLLIETTATAKRIISEEGSLEVATITKLTVDEVIIGTGEQKLAFKDGFLQINGKTFPHINPANLKPLTLLTLSPANAIELYPIEWLTINSVKMDLAIQGTNILETINKLKEEIRQLKGE